MHSSANLIFQQVGVYLQAGEKAAARELLKRYLKQHPTDVDAWYWLSLAVETRAEMVFCLQHVDRLQRGNRKTIGLQNTGHHAVAAQPTLPAQPVLPAPAIPITGTVASKPASHQSPPPAPIPAKPPARRFFLPAAIVILIALLVGSYFLFFSNLTRPVAEASPDGEPSALAVQTLAGQPTAAPQHTALPATVVPATALPTAFTSSIAAIPSPRVAYQGTDNNIYIYYLDTGENVRVTTLQSPEQWYGAPAWSPDGSRLAYCQMSMSDLGMILYIAAADGSNPRELLERSSCQFDWTPDGGSLTVNDYGEIRGTPVPASPFPWSLWNVDASTGKKTLLVEAFNGHTLALPYWSPDGEWLLFHEITSMEGSGNLISWNTKTGARFQAFQGDLGLAGFASFSPDGTRLVFDECSGFPQPGMGIYISDPYGQDRRKIFSDLTRGAAGAQWSPDGETIAFRLGVEPWSPVSLMVMQADGSGARSILENYRGAYVWSQDGQWLLIHNNGELLIHHLASGAQTRLTKASPYGTPDWFLPAGAPPIPAASDD